MATEVLAGYDMDAATAALCFQLQLEDLRNVSARGKGRVGGDAQLAQELYSEELKLAAASSVDRLMAQSIATAVRQDGPSISAALARDDSIARDHDLAVQLSKGRRNATSAGPSQAGPRGPATDPHEDEFIEKLDALYMKRPSENDSSEEHSSVAVVASSSSAPAPRTYKKKKGGRPTRRCVACQEDFEFFDLARVPCDHEYCRDCLRHLLQSAVTDESLYPPRCCRQPFDLQKLRLFVPLKTIEEVESKKIEYSSANRTYCHVPDCSTFVPQQNIVNDVATCPRCSNRTCTTCKGDTHEGDCPRDEGLRQVINLAVDQGWQRCPKCWTGVELGEGCYHITCRCGHDFCYVCGEQWKTCACQQWDPVRLTRRARQLVDRNAAAPLPEIGDLVPAPRAIAQPALPPPPRLPGRSSIQPGSVAGIASRPPTSGNVDYLLDPSDEDEEPLWGPDLRHWLGYERPHDPGDDAELEEMMRNLEDNHDCDHTSWRWVGGPHQCEQCFFTLPKYIFECQRCRIQVCNRCRHNRFGKIVTI